MGIYCHNTLSFVNDDDDFMFNQFSPLVHYGIFDAKATSKKTEPVAL